MDIRRSNATHENPAVKSSPAKKNEGNADWFASRVRKGSIVLAGGATLEHFRVRVAQSHLRNDMLPSFWSLAGVAVSTTSFFTVPLEVDNVSAVPSANAIRRVNFRELDDVTRFPNTAALRFAEPSDAIVRNVEKLMTQRIAVDLPTMILPWLGFVWSAGAKVNPLLEGEGLPSAALVQTAFGMSGIELAPGLGSGSSCPEAIWQSAIWWHEYYEKTADVYGSRAATDETSPGKAEQPRPIVPVGQYQLRQRAAAIIHET